MIELDTFIGVLFILIGSMFGFQILIYLELRDIERRTCRASVRRIHGTGKST